MKSTIAHVTWFDSCITDHSAVAPEDAATISEMESCGLLIREDKASITLALDRSKNHGWLRSTICIPKVNVRKITRFKVKRP